MNVTMKCVFATTVIAMTMSISATSNADEGYVYSYADQGGWAVQYLMDRDLNVQAVRVGVPGGSFMPNPLDDDEPYPPIGPWVKIQFVELAYGQFAKVMGFKPNPEDDDPWGPLGPVVRLRREYIAMGMNNAMYMPNPCDPYPVWPWPWPGPNPWRFDDFDTWDIDVMTEMGTRGKAMVIQSVYDLDSLVGREPTPWLGYEQLLDQGK